MYYACTPTRIAIYVNPGLKSASAIQRELKCDALINGGLYDMKWFTPNCWLRVDGKTLHSEAWSDFGYGWDENKLVMDTSANIKLYKNFISCVSLVRGGKAIPLSYPAEIGGKRGRSAIGVRQNGNVILYCVQDGTSWALTPETLQKEMLDLGAVSALMLDGGASSQCVLPVGTIMSYRTVQNYIAIWTGKPPKENPQCPYAEPTHNIRWGSIGEGAKWVQWMLTQKGFPCEVDGLFFGGSADTLKAFQKAQGLTADGVCGPVSRSALKQ